jgi:hypothetical protein
MAVSALLRICDYFHNIMTLLSPVGLIFRGLHYTLFAEVAVAGGEDCDYDYGGDGRYLQYSRCCCLHHHHFHIKGFQFQGHNYLSYHNAVVMMPAGAWE